jgi:hypothetical protein
MSAQAVRGTDLKVRCFKGPLLQRPAASKVRCFKGPLL